MWSYSTTPPYAFIEKCLTAHGDSLGTSDELPSFGPGTRRGPLGRRRESGQEPSHITLYHLLQRRC